MSSMKSIEVNLKFLVLEVSKQLEDCLAMLEDPNCNNADKINSRDDYIDTLKNLIETKCFFQGGSRDKKTVDMVRAIDVITNNLEKIGDYAVNIVRQTRFFKDKDYINRFEYRKYFKEIAAAFKLVIRALNHRDVNVALKICRCEFKLDEFYKNVFDQILLKLESGKDTQNLLTCLFIFGYMERVGDSLLNIGEAVISSALGEKLKIHQYEAFRETMQKSSLPLGNSGISFKSMGETRSGCLIDKVQANSPQVPEQGVIFKEGNLRKIQQEKDNIEKWNQLSPGLVPRVFGYHQNSRSGSILLEFLRGRNLKEIALNAEEALLAESIESLCHTLTTLWDKTRDSSPTSINFMNQMLARIDDVYKVHPAFRHHENRQIGRVTVPHLKELLQQGVAVESQLHAPFAVQIHGDFNLDNIMYDPDKKTVHFIDLYRSARADYCQDISVFLVSNFRIPVFKDDIRARLGWVALRFLKFAREYAQKNNDALFEIRLALGVMRSLVTSTRFELNEDFAKRMYLRAEFILEKIIAHSGKDYRSFKLKPEIYIY